MSPTSFTRFTRWFGGGCILVWGAMGCGDASTDTFQSTGRRRAAPEDLDAGPLLDGGREAGALDAALPPPADGGSRGETLFRGLESTLVGRCGACHAGTTGSAPKFLAGPDVYKTIKKVPRIVVEEHRLSVLLTYPVLGSGHQGPPLPNDALRTQVTDWLAVEAAELPKQKVLETGDLTIRMGQNLIDLSTVTPSVQTASISFYAKAIGANGNILELANLTVSAPPTEGLHVVGPSFVVKVPGQSPSVDDSMSGLDQTVQAGYSSPLDSGLLHLTGWSANATLRVRFKGLTLVGSTNPPGVGGCKSLSTFTASAAPALLPCLQCHAAGGTGAAALDLSGLSAPRDDARACAQAKTKANPQNPSSSAIIRAPTGAIASHPFRTQNANFAQALTTWISNEQ